MIKKLQQGELIKVHWRDTFSMSGWWTEKEIKDKIFKDIKEIESIGYFVRKYRSLLVIAMSQELSKEFNPWGNWKGIPIGVITRIKKLKETK